MKGHLSTDDKPKPMTKKSSGCQTATEQSIIIDVNYKPTAIANDENKDRNVGQRKSNEDLV